MKTSHITALKNTIASVKVDGPDNWEKLLTAWKFLDQEEKLQLAAEQQAAQAAEEAKEQEVADG